MAVNTTESVTRQEVSAQCVVSLRTVFSPADAEVEL